VSVFDAARLLALQADQIEPRPALKIVTVGDNGGRACRRCRPSCRRGGWGWQRYSCIELDRYCAVAGGQVHDLVRRVAIRIA
jgi:hypothetical protein